MTEAVVELVKAGMGVSVLARWAIEPHLAAGTLLERPLGREGYHRQWSAAMLRSAAMPPYLAEFVRLLAEHPLPIAMRGGAKRGKRKARRGLAALEHVTLDWQAPRCAR